MSAGCRMRLVLNVMNIIVPAPDNFCCCCCCCEVILGEVTPESDTHRILFPPPSQGLIVLCTLNQHMAVRIYRPASNQSAAFRASLRRAQPISAAERDPCLWIVLRRGHVTLGKGMPTWIRGKDATWVRYDNNTTRGARKRENTKRHRRRRFLHRPTFGLNTVGRGRFSGSPWSDLQRDGGGVWNIFFWPSRTWESWIPLQAQL